MLYKRDDEIAFVQQAKPNLAAGTAFYKVLPNGYPFIELLQLYLHHLADPTDAWLDAPTSISVDYVWLGRNFVRLRIAMKNWDERGANAALSALEKKQHLLHPDQVSFIEFCKTFVSRLMQPLLWGSPLFLAPSMTARARAWWSLPCDLSVAADQQIQDLRSRFPGKLPLVLQHSFHRWLTSLKTWLDTRLFVPRQSDALREASALCDGLAHIHYGLGRYSLALLYCHRAADLLLFSECAAAGLVDFTANSGGGELKQPPGVDPQISILKCHDRLVANQNYLLNLNRRKAFNELNTYRNLLLVTHYLGAVSSATAKSLMSAAATELSAIGGSGWTTSSQATRQAIDLKTHEFFDLSDGLMGTLVPG